jgi:glycosyltransferase involved in cell wall biosynthesis
MSIAVSVIILTKNEESRLALTLECLAAFDDIWVVDSHSADSTTDIAHHHGASVIDFTWNGAYPKKKQWALDNLSVKYEWVLLIDADERMTDALSQEIEDLFQNGPPPAQGYFITGLYRIGDQILKHGVRNNKLMLFARDAFAFPPLIDRAFEGGWEVEGHYQPIARRCDVSIERLDHALIHDAFECEDDLNKRHEAYALWEARMNLHQAWPQDPVASRQRLKVLYRARPLRGLIMFVYGYVLRLGMLDGRQGLKFALMRARYYKDVAAKTAQLKKQRECL